MPKMVNQSMPLNQKVASLSCSAIYISVNTQRIFLTFYYHHDLKFLTILLGSPLKIRGWPPILKKKVCPQSFFLPLCSLYTAYPEDAINMGVAWDFPGGANPFPLYATCLPCSGVVKIFVKSRHLFSHAVKVYIELDYAEGLGIEGGWDEWIV